MHDSWREIGIPIGADIARPNLARFTPQTKATHARGDLIQLRALCDAADGDAFAPLAAEQLTDQRTAGFIIQLGGILQSAVDLAVSEGVLCIRRLRTQASWQWIGRYARIASEGGTGMWIGIHFGLWRAHGATPLWLSFSEGEFGRAQEVRQLIEPWAERQHVLTINKGWFAIALNVLVGEEKERIVRNLVEQLRAIADVLRALPPGSGESKEPDGGEPIV